MERRLGCKHLFEERQMHCCRKWVCIYCTKLWLDRNPPPLNMRVKLARRKR